jgi:PAS domain S-box-containing protein
MATILIVDDLSANRQFLVTLLGHSGHRLLEAGDGSEGLAAVRTGRPDLVITDVLMPVMDGYEFVRRLRLDSATSGIPVVFYTAHYGEREARELALSGGVSDVLRKPARSEDVLKIVERVLSGKSTAIPSDLSRVPSEFGREHLRLLTNKLSETTGDLKTSNARLRALINIGLELTSDRDPNRLIERVSMAACDLFGATYVTIGILDLNRRTVQRVVTCGAEAAVWIKSGEVVPGILGTVVAERRTLRGDNPGGDPAALELPPLHPKIQAFLAAPIASAAHVYGWICLIGNEGRTFSDDDEDLVRALSGQVGRIHELAHEILVREQAESALRGERDRAQRYLDTAEVTLLALRTAEERMRFALEAAAVGIWDMDYTTGVLRWSETLEAQYGLQPGTFAGTFEAFVERVHPDDRESVVETLGKAMKLGSDFSIQHRSTWPDGTIRRLSGAGRIHLGEQGEPIRGVGISLDVTERRMLEEQYQQAQKMEAIGRLAGGVAHDFNNLLTVILGHGELLLDELAPDDARRTNIAEIQKAGERGAGLTRQLLAFSRKQIIEPTLLNLNTVVTDMRAMLARLIGEDVEVVLGLRPELACIKADRGQVEQIVLNLAVNARDAMPGGGTLTIETANVMLDENYPKSHLAVTPGPYVALTVTDTGTAMTPQVQARLFEPFFTTKEPGKGTGLGLATVHGIVMRSGGSVNVYSEVGRGTSFKVYFPKSDATETIDEGPPPRPRPPAGTQTVLIAEDAEGLGDLVKRFLERQGYTVLLAANPDEALQLFEGNASIAVLLTDVVMPGGSGPELARRLVERRPALKVIYMSGYTEETIVRHGVLNPGIAFLHKPFTSEALGRKIREVLDRA